jgi:uncharacterized SAM-binding protein YcdF (DUF218 family)
MFFYLSKILWFFAEPGNALLLALVIGLFLTFTRFKKLGRSVVTLVVVAALVITFVPFGNWMRIALEDRFPPQDLSLQSVDGIIVLGGVISPQLSAARETLAIGGAVERITESAALARANPSAKLIFTGGTGSLTQTDLREADYVVSLYETLGVRPPQLLIDRDARNTWENANNARGLVSPGPYERWVLVTSAFHMPRAVGVFRAQGWEVIPYPVDYSTNPNAKTKSPMSFTTGLGSLYGAIHEWIGLIAYWLNGKSDAAFPRPRQ